MSVRDIIQSAAGLGGEEPDPNFNQTVLLLHGDGTNGAQNNTFLDSSSNNFTITRNGNTTQGSFSPYGDLWSNYFDGTGDYLTAPNNAAFDFGSGDFTIEAWVSNTATSTGRIASKWASGGNLGWTFLVYQNAVQFAFTSDGSNIAFNNTAGTTSVGSSWVHAAVVRSGSNFYYYFNGTRIGSYTSSATIYNTSTNLYIGAQEADVPTVMDGYISNLRIVKGTALYTTNFTPPTAPLTAVSGTSLLTCQSNRFRDASSNNFTITRNGDVRVTNFAPFAPNAAYSASTNGASGYFDGDGDGDSLSSSTAFEASPSASTFTLEGWVYPTTFAELINIFGGIAVTSGDAKTIAAEVNTSGQVALYWYDGTIKRCTGNTVMQLMAWNYFAIVVSGNAISIYVNKTTADSLTGTTTLTARTQTFGLGVGGYYSNGNVNASYLNGYLSGLRYSTVARTISSIPTAPFSSDANTRWLLNFANAAIFDNTQKNDLETVGNAQISTSVKKYGTGSIYCNGSGNYLRAPDIPPYWLSGDFTVELWVYIAGGTNEIQAVINQRSGGQSGTQFTITYNAGTYQMWCWIDKTSIFTYRSGNTIPTSQWVHLAWTRQGTTFRTFINGALNQTATQTIAPVNQTVPLSIGGDDAGFDQFFTGYVDEVRLTQGVARYTANFTPPNKAFPNT